MGPNSLNYGWSTSLELNSHELGRFWQVWWMNAQNDDSYRKLIEF